MALVDIIIVLIFLAITFFVEMMQSSLLFQSALFQVLFVVKGQSKRLAVLIAIEAPMHKSTLL